VERSNEQPKRDSDRQNTVERSIIEKQEESHQQQQERIRSNQANQSSTRISVFTRQPSTTRIPVATKLNQQTNYPKMAKMKGSIDTMRTKMSSLYISDGDSRKAKGATVPRGMVKTVNLNMSKNTVHTHEANGANRKTPPMKSHTKVDEDGFMIVINGSPNRQTTKLSDKLPDTSTKNSFTALQQEDDDHYDTVDFIDEHETNNRSEASKLLPPMNPNQRKIPFNATTQQNMLVATD
jgi:hypothetical protein